MEVDFAVQAVTFLWALAAGVGLSLLYDVFRVLRLVLRSKSLGIFLQDLLYAFLAALVTYVLLLVRCRGELRGYVLLGELCGFILCRLSLSAVLYAWAARLVSLVRRAKRWVKRKIIRPILRILRRFFVFLSKQAKKLWKSVKASTKFTQKAKKGLKQAAGMVYNQTVRRKNQAGPAQRKNPARKKRRRRVKPQ